MQTKKDCSYGVIPVIQDKGRWKVFLIYQYGSKGDVYWTFPKGHPEKGETQEETALRELKEETGIALERLESNKTYVQSYTFLYKNTMIEKTVEYYLGFAESMTFHIQDDEIKEARWFILEEARSKLTHENAKIMFDEIISDLK